MMYFGLLLPLAYVALVLLGISAFYKIVTSLVTINRTLVEIRTILEQLPRLPVSQG